MATIHVSDVEPKDIIRCRATGELFEIVGIANNPVVFLESVKTEERKHFICGSPVSGEYELLKPDKKK